MCMLDPDSTCAVGLEAGTKMYSDTRQNSFVATVMAQGSLICASKQIR